MVDTAGVRPYLYICPYCRNKFYDRQTVDVCISVHQRGGKKRKRKRRDDGMVDGRALGSWLFDDPVNALD